MLDVVGDRRYRAVDLNAIGLNTIAFEQSARDIKASSRCLLGAFAYLGIPKTFLDLGCGPGHLVQLANKLGASSMGIDLCVEPVDMLYTLIKGNILNDNLRPSELVVCWEVAEHIAECNADRLCDVIARHTMQDLLFSAAVTGQGGSGHVNEQPNDYWINKLTSRGRGLDFNSSLTWKMRQVFRHVAPDCPWYGQNLIVMQKKKGTP